MGSQLSCFIYARKTVLMQYFLCANVEKAGACRERVGRIDFDCAAEGGALENPANYRTLLQPVKKVFDLVLTMVMKADAGNHNFQSGFQVKTNSTAPAASTLAHCAERYCYFLLV